MNKFEELELNRKGTEEKYFNLASKYIMDILRRKNQQLETKMKLLGGRLFSNNDTKFLKDLETEIKTLVYIREAIEYRHKYHTMIRDFNTILDVLNGKVEGYDMNNNKICEWKKGDLDA